MSEVRSGCAVRAAIQDEQAIANDFESYWHHAKNNPPYTPKALAQHAWRAALGAKWIDASIKQPASHVYVLAVSANTVYRLFYDAGRKGWYGVVDKVEWDVKFWQPLPDVPKT